MLGDRFNKDHVAEGDVRARCARQGIPVRRLNDDLKGRNVGITPHRRPCWHLLGSSSSGRLVISKYLNTLRRRTYTWGLRPMRLKEHQVDVHHRSGGLVGGGVLRGWRSRSVEFNVVYSSRTPRERGWSKTRHILPFQASGARCWYFFALRPASCPLSAPSLRPLPPSCLSFDGA